MRRIKYNDWWCEERMEPFDPRCHDPEPPGSGVLVVMVAFCFWIIINILMIVTWPFRFVADKLHRRY